MTTRNPIDAPAALAATAVLALLWVLLVGLRPESWVVGAPALALALAAGATVPRGERPGVRLGALARLTGAFLRDSLRGAIDVGARSIARDPALHTRLVRWRTRLRSPAARLALVHLVSLVPGTLTARIEDDTLWIHLLDERGPWREEIEALEVRIADALEPPAGIAR